MVELGLPGRDLKQPSDEPSEAPLWRVAPAGSYEWREWAGQAVVFVHATGDTHALSLEATSLLAAMRAFPDQRLPASCWVQLARLDAAEGDYDESLMRALEAIGLAGHEKS